MEFSEAWWKPNGHICMHFNSLGFPLKMFKIHCNGDPHSIRRWMEFFMVWGEVLE